MKRCTNSTVNIFLLLDRFRPLGHPSSVTDNWRGWHHAIAGYDLCGMILPSQVDSYWRWPIGRKRFSNKKIIYCEISTPFHHTSPHDKHPLHRRKENNFLKKLFFKVGITNASRTTVRGVSQTYSQLIGLLFRLSSSNQPFSRYI